MSDTSKRADKKNSKKKIRSKRGLGRLYKRNAHGKECKADSNADGHFWLEYKVNGKRIRQRLLDDAGNPIKNIDAAKELQAKIMAPIVAEDEVGKAKAVAAKVMTAEAKLAQAVEEANPPLKISEVWDAYLNSTERPDSGEATLLRYAGHWKRFREWIATKDPEAVFMREITPKTAQDYAKDLQQAGVSPNTYNKHITFLKLLCRALEEPARFKENPFKRIRRKQLKTNVRRELSIAELKAILEKAGGELQTLFMLGTFTGLRLGDCCTLKWGEVDLDRGLIRRIPNKTAKNGKPVVVGIPSALYTKLSETPKGKRKGYVVPKYAELYTHKNENGEPIRRPIITREIKRVFEDCEIQTQQEGTGKVTDENGSAKDTGKRAVVDVSFHSLRHTWVSIQAEAGTPQAVVQSIIGHSNPAMTAHYTHIGETAALKAAEVITLNETKRKGDRQVPPWIQDLAQTMTAKNWKKIKAVLVEGAECF